MLTLSADAQVEDCEASLAAAPDDLLVKPVDREGLHQVLDAAPERASNPACSLTQVSPHCHNSVVGPWCRGTPVVHQ